MIIEQIKASSTGWCRCTGSRPDARGRAVERELALIKVAGKGEKRIEALRIADVFRARVVDATPETFVFEMTGATDKIDASSS